MFATANNFPASRVSRVPDGVSLETAAVIIANYNTALYALIDRARVKPGEAMLVLGAAGGTGIAAIQVGKHLGLHVIASASSEEKRHAALSAGADVAVETGAADWRDQVRAANQGRPVDIVFDPVGGSLSELALRTLDYDGRHLVIGFTAGIPSIPTNLALLKSVSVVGVHLGDTMKRWPRKGRWAADQGAGTGCAGRDRSRDCRALPLQEFVAAMNSAQAGKAAGRIVIVMD